MGSVVSGYLESQASAHRLDARSKIAMLAVWSVGIFFVETWAGMAAYAAMFFAVLFASKVDCTRVFSLVAPVYAIAALTVVFNMFSIHEGTISFSIEGLSRGCFFAARILLLVWASMVLSFSCSSIELTSAFGSILSPLRALKVPVDDVATVFSIAVRFVPQFAIEFLSIRDAQWCRGGMFDEGPISVRVKSYCAIIVPMVIGMFRRADRLALSMDMRCYGMKAARRTDIRVRRIKASSVAAMIASIAACSAIAVLL